MLGRARFLWNATSVWRGLRRPQTSQERERRASRLERDAQHTPVLTHTNKNANANTSTQTCTYTQGRQGHSPPSQILQRQRLPPNS
jgi:hypothetical protein